MSASTDRVLSVIDAGLQTPVPDPTFGEVSPVNHDGCTRCGVDVPTAASLCVGCRAFLLGDSDEDPAKGADPDVLGGVSVAEVSAVFEALIPAFREWGQRRREARERREQER